MDSKKPKKHHHCKKDRIKAQERFAQKVPYRCDIHSWEPVDLLWTPSGCPGCQPLLLWFTWLSGSKPNTLQPWEVLKIHSSLREQLPLQKMLVPTRSIPIRGLGAPDFTALPRPCPTPPSNLWEIKLLSRRFPKQGAHVLSLQRVTTNKPT